MEGGETVRSIYQTITCGGLALALCLALLPAPEAGAACSFQFRPLAGPGSAPATETCVVSGSNGLPVELLSFRAE
jgi:hypothetical protein